MLLDTSVLIELQRRPATDPLVRRILEAMGEQPLFASPIHLGEIADAARRDGLPPEETAARALQVVDLVPLTADIAIAASGIKADARRKRSGRDFSLIDGIGLASARSLGVPMLTLDHEFDGLDGVTVLDRVS